MKTPFLHLYPAADNSGADDECWRAVWALRLESCPTERLSHDNADVVGARRLRLGTELLRALTASRASQNSDGERAPSIVFALRYLLQPAPTRGAGGRIEVALLGQATQPDAERASREARALWEECRALLGGALPDHSWQTADTEAELDALWRPFALETAHVAEVRRRESVLALPELNARPALGQGAAASETASAVTLVHPFAPHAVELSRLLRALLLHPHPLVWQTTIAPAQLTVGEIAALRAQMARCERPEQQRQANRDALFAPAAQFPEALAHDMGRALGQQLACLQTAPLLLNVALFSPQPLPPSLAAACGAAISAATSHAPESSGATLQNGGFSVAWPVSDEQHQTARRNAGQLEFAPWGRTPLPPALQRLSHLADASEASGAFRLPWANSEGLPGLTVRTTRLRPVPPEVAALSRGETGASLPLGVNRYLGQQQEIFLTEADRRQHVYVVGQTGTGKTTLLKNLALADMEAGHGVAVVDPHGDLFEELLALVPAHRREDVIVFDPTDKTQPVGLNMLECHDEDERYFVVREMRAIMERLMNDQYQSQAAHFTGPTFYQHMQVNMLLAMSDLDDPGTLLEFHQIFQQPDYWKRWLPLRWSDSRLRSWVDNVLPSTDYLKRGSEVLSMGEYLSSRFEDFLFDPRLRLIFGQKRSTIDLRCVMDEGKILLVNLAKGHLSEANARFLGMILMAKLQAAAMSRIDLPVAQRRPFYLYVDEFQSLATQNFTLLLSEARKFGVGLTLANQFAAQIEDQRITRALFGNVGTLIAFRVGRADAELLAPLLQSHFDADDLTNLPNWQACLKTTVGGQTATPFSLQTLLPAALPDTAMSDDLRAVSAARYGRPRVEVEAEIERGYATKRSPSPRMHAARQEFVALLEQYLSHMRAARGKSGEPEAVSEKEFQMYFAALPLKERRKQRVPEGMEMILDNPNLPVASCLIRSLDDLSERINLSSARTIARHVTEERNDLADWVERVFGLKEMAEQLRRYPTSLRMTISIEKYLRSPQDKKPT